MALPSPRISEAVITGPDGLLDGARDGTIRGKDVQKLQALVRLLVQDQP